MYGVETKLRMTFWWLLDKVTSAISIVRLCVCVGVVLCCSTVTIAPSSYSIHQRDICIHFAQRDTHTHKCIVTLTPKHCKCRRAISSKSQQISLHFSFEWQIYPFASIQIEVFGNKLVFFQQNCVC